MKKFSLESLNNKMNSKLLLFIFFSQILHYSSLFLMYLPKKIFFIKKTRNTKTIWYRNKTLKKKIEKNKNVCYKRVRVHVECCCQLIKNVNTVCEKQILKKKRINSLKMKIPKFSEQCAKSRRENC